MSEDGELVECGTLRVDAEAAAGKLGAYQLEDPETFLVPWFRAAAALGAGRVLAGAEGGGVELRFDGMSLGEEALREPLRGLMVDLGEAARHLAWGALALRRLGPSSVEARRDGTLTRLWAGWDGGADSGRRVLAKLKAAYGMAETALEVDGKAVPDPSRAGTRVKTWKSRDVRVVVLREPRLAGRIRFYKLGMLVEEEEFDLAGPYVAYAQSRRFALNLSQSRILKDRRYQRTRDRLGRLRRRLAMRPSPVERLVDRFKDLLGLEER